MTPYTICVNGLPVLVMSVDAGELQMPDDLVLNPKIRAAMTATNEVKAQVDALVVKSGGSLEEFNDSIAIREIDDAVDSWLGADLLAKGLWNGEPDQVSARKATPDEAATWLRSQQAAIDAGDADAVEDWLTYLVETAEDDE
jgi:hypothetical protein